MTTAEKEKYKCLLPSLSGNQEVWLCMANILVISVCVWFSSVLFDQFIVCLIFKGWHEGVWWTESSCAAGAVVQAEQLLIQSEFHFSVSIYSL